MENLVLMSFAVYSISPSDQVKNIAVSLSRHFPTPYSTRLQLYMKIQLQLLLPVRSTDPFIGSHFHIETPSSYFQIHQKPKCDYSNRRSDITGSRLHRKLEIETISIVVNTEMKILQEIFLLVLFNLIESSLTCIGKL